jgi:hypothetical protein
MDGDTYARLSLVAAKTDDVLLTREAIGLGIGDQDCRRLRRISREYGLPRGALALPPVRDGLRARARAAHLLVPRGVLCGPTAARLLGLQGLPRATPTNPIHLSLPRRRTRWQRKDMLLHWRDVPDEEIVLLDGLHVTAAERTLLDLQPTLDRATFICLADSAAQQGLLPPERLALLRDELPPGLAEDWRLVDGRSESPSETLVRLVLVEVGLGPDELQLQVRDANGRVIARLDLGWRRRRFGLEVDSGEHDRPSALYRDRYRQNELLELGWDIRRVTAADARNRPSYVRSMVRAALSEAA